MCSIGFLWENTYMAWWFECNSDGVRIRVDCANISGGNKGARFCDFPRVPLSRTFDCRSIWCFVTIFNLENSQVFHLLPFCSLLNVRFYRGLQTGSFERNGLEWKVGEKWHIRTIRLKYPRGLKHFLGMCV